MEQLPKRKRTRLPDYDYSAPGAYFITVCTQGRKCILSEIVAGGAVPCGETGAHRPVGAIHESPAVQLTQAGLCVQRAVERLAEQYTNLRVEKYVIMPNHVHLLLEITEDRAVRERPLRSKRERSLVDKAIGFMKMNSSRLIHISSPNSNIWQRSYHDHIIRGEDDYREIWNYIDTNPARWCEDCFYPNPHGRFTNRPQGQCKSAGRS